jgi:pimeloyl-ACP methyl ester carboxylesterase
MRLLAFLLTLVTSSSSATQRPAIVLVHGAFADASSWSKVIPLLEKDGYFVTAVQIPLTSLPDDVATAKRVIDAQKGPVVVVGHSYAGAVITDAAAGNANVKSLVYVAAFAPDAGETVTEAGSKFSPPPLGSALVPDAAGFLYVERDKVHDVFCKDIPVADARVIAATQKPPNQSVFGARVVNVAWKTIPSWYIVGTEDRAINPDLERFYARRMNAKTTELKSSHVPFLSHPKEVVQVIEDAGR